MEVTTKVGVVKVDTSLNVRKGPGTNYSVVDRLYNGKQVTIMGEKNSFYKVQYKTGVTTNATANLNVRKGAGINYAVIGTLKPKSQVIILNEDGKWLRIAYYINGKRIEGYVSSSYVKIG